MLKVGSGKNRNMLMKTKKKIRPESIDINGNSLELPAFIRSVSSFESQLAPDEALTALHLIPNSDPLLISAFDFYIPENANRKEIRERNEKLRLLDELHERGCFILLDSGNYEASRTTCNQWSEEKYEKTLSQISFTCAFSFDNLYPSKDLKKNMQDTVERANKLESDFVLPIVHAPLMENGMRDSAQIPDIMYEVSKLKKAHLIAVPERELGEGIFERIHMVKRIRDRLNELGYYQPFHILGTGNPVSIALLSYAGADSFDGLEWCRTAIDRKTGLLYHHQQYDFFRHQTKTMAQFDTVRKAEEDEGVSLMLKMALHNLDFLHGWMSELRNNLRGEKITDMLSFYLPEHVYNVILLELQDIKEE